MGFRFITFFYILFVVCHEGANGARDVFKQEGIEKHNVAYITGYGSKERTQDVEASYITQYGTKEHRKEEDVEASYITQYGTKEAKKEEDVEASYITQYGTKEYKKEENIEAPYITCYISTQGSKGTESEETPYITQYGDKGDSHKILEGTKEGTLDSKEVESPYIRNKVAKNVEAPYVTRYTSTQGAKKHEHGHHHGHMHADMSSPIDHTKALKQGFFTFEDFYKGNALPLNFPKQESFRFLPKETSDSIPFSTSQLPHLLQLFSTPSDSREAKHMAWTLDQCELKPIKGETKFCATSLESMMGFVQQIIGSGVTFDILSTILPETSISITQKYTILENPKEVIASKMVFCHPVPYPYAVFFCHHFEKDTKFFKVSLLGENGDKGEAVAVCHMDTSDWDPKHALFHLLGIKAGATSPVCHFFPANHLVWLPSSPPTVTF